MSDEMDPESEAYAQAQAEAMRLGARYQAQAPPRPVGVEVSDMFGYLHCKAFVYLDLGPDGYRRLDALEFPPFDWPASTLETVRRGCEQILQWRGLTPEHPLEGLGIGGFRTLMQMFHFDLVMQAAMRGPDGTMVDMMRMGHVLNSQEVVLYNRVALPASGPA